MTRCCFDSPNSLRPEFRISIFRLSHLLPSHDSLGNRLPAIAIGKRCTHNFSIIYGGRVSLDEPLQHFLTLILRSNGQRASHTSTTPEPFSFLPVEWKSPPSEPLEPHSQLYSLKKVEEPRSANHRSPNCHQGSCFNATMQKDAPPFQVSKVVYRSAHLIMRSSDALLSRFMEIPLRNPYIGHVLNEKALYEGSLRISRLKVKRPSTKAEQDELVWRIQALHAYSKMAKEKYAEEEAMAKWMIFGWVKVD